MTMLCNTGVLGIVVEPEHLVVPLTLAIEFSPRSPTQLWVGRKKPVISLTSVACPGFFSGGGSTNSVEDRGQRGRGSGGGRPLVRGSGGSCNLVQEISFHIVKFS